MKNLSNEIVLHTNKNGVQFLQFKKLLEFSDILVHAYSLGLDRNFRTSNLEQNTSLKDYKDLCNEINANYINLVKPNQAHTKNVTKVEHKINIDKPDFYLEQYNSTDGTVTNKKNILLATTNADCILLLFFDPINKVIANVHSGWRGTLQRISVEAIHKMQKEYSCKPENIICCICPSIRKCHFEVEQDVEKLFEEEFKEELKENNKNEEIIERKNEIKWTIDTVKLNKIILQKEGLKSENILDCGICSVCNSDLIHSFRCEKQGYGLETAIIGLK